MIVSKINSVLRIGLMVLIFCQPSSLLAAQDIPNVSLSGCCIVKDGETLKNPGKSCDTSTTAEAAIEGGGLLAALATSAVTALAEEGISSISNWVKSFRKSFDGKASGSELVSNLLSCDDDLAGHYKKLSFSLSKVDEKMLDAGNKKIVTLIEGTEYFKLTGELTIINDPFDKSFRSVLFTPTDLKFEGTIAKRGSAKDIVVTFTTKSVDGAGKPITQTSTPFSMQKLKKGNTYKYTGSVLPPVEIAKISRIGDIAPMQVKVDVLETGLGKGAQLADKLTSAITDTLEKEKDGLVKEIVGFVIKPETPPATAPPATTPPAKAE